MILPSRLPNSLEAARYFDGQATVYGVRSDTGFWQFVRKYEARCVCEMIGEPTGMSFLDLGAGAGYYAKLFARMGATSVDAVDLSEKMIRVLPRDIHGIVGDIAACNLGRQYERIVCAGALEFVDDPWAVFSNAYRHAKPRARFVTLVPHNSFVGRLYQEFHRRHGLFIRVFSASTIKQLGAETGWTLENLRTRLPFALVATFRKHP